MEIISKRDGPDRKTRELKHLIDRNRGTIEKLANQLTQGTWPARPKPPTLAEPVEKSRSFGFMPTSSEREVEPYVRISPNDRVVLMDMAGGRQLALLGQIRGGRGARRFALATAANGFVEPLESELAARLHDLEGAEIDGVEGEECLARTLRERLGLPPEAQDDADA